MNSVTLGAAALRNSIVSNFSHALHSPPVAADSPATGLDTPSPSADDVQAQSGGSGVAVAGADGKRLARRVMPARLRRVSSLLTGSILEEEMAGAAAKEAEPSGLFRGNTAVTLTTENIESTPVAYTAAEPAALLNAGGGARQQIETPEFRVRDDSEVMGKTRSLRSEEDTSDAAYERRHRKADNAEKRLRRWEKENLKKDRQKIVERMEHLKNTDARSLAPILTVREQRERQFAVDGSSNAVEHSATVASAAAETDLAAQQAKLEQLRDDLVDECKAILRRYDALLTVPVDEVPAPSHVGKRKKALDDDGGHTSSAASANEDADAPYRPPRRTISVSGAFARKSASSVAGLSSKGTAGAAKANGSGSALRASASTSALSDSPTDRKPNTKYSARDIKAKRLSLERTPRPFTESDGSLRAEHTYANIHARTSGGRFAPKVALVAIPGAAPASRSKINTKTGRAKATAIEAQRRKGGRPRKSAETSNAAASSSSTAGAAAEMPSRRSRGRPPKSDGSAAAAAAPSPEIPQEGVRTRRVKLIFNRNGSAKGESSSSAAAPASAASSNSSSTISTPASLTPPRHVKAEDNGDQSGTAVMVDKRDADGDLSMDSEGELDAALPTSSTPARSALTLEEAQALLMKAMADGEDEDAMDAAAAAATMMPSRGQ